jgi:hypothetical protein
MEVDRRSIKFVGRLNAPDAEVLRRELTGVVDKNGAINGRPLCLALRTSKGSRSYVGDSIPAVIAVLKELSGNSAFQSMWGGGGLTFVGWMGEKDLALVKSLRSVLPLDVSSVGVNEELPGKVRLRLERVNISPTRFVQFEQFHPKAGLITLSTTSKVLLRACPGGWRGSTPVEVWKSAKCVDFSSSSPAVLPDPGNDHTHLSVAIRTVLGKASMVDLDLRYVAIDPSFECYVDGRRSSCTLLPPRLAG